jgi:hypothetical protein
MVQKDNLMHFMNISDGTIKHERQEVVVPLEAVAVPSSQHH